ncbi:MAG: 30S ribosomal protein S1 [Syntrophaceae bacterium]
MVEENKADLNKEEKSFAQLLDEIPAEPGFFRPGQVIEAKIVRITPEWIFLDVGGKSEGYLDARELLNDKGELTIREGEPIRVYFLSSRENELHFTTRITGAEAGRAFLEEAAQNHIPVEGTVTKEVKGGYEIRLPGGLRGFCPYSQMGTRRTENAAELIGQRRTFRILEYREKGRNIILSNRAVLEEEDAARREQIKSRLSEGAILMGTVTAIRDFGAFVDIDGVQGLIPYSELSWERGADINQLLKPGQEVNVRIIKLDPERDRITLSLRAAQPDPWENILEKYPVGSRHTGRVGHLEEFGAFVSLEPGVDGLIHISKMRKGKKLRHAREALAEGEQVEVEIEKIKKGKRRISLALVATREETLQREKEEHVGDYSSEPASPFGSMGDLLKERMQEREKGK